MIRLSTFALLVTLAAGCGGGSSGTTTGSSSGGTTSGAGSGSSSGSSSGSGTTSGTAQYDTLMGTFSAQSGVQATFTGAMEAFDLGTGSSFTSCGAFTESSICATAPKVTVTSPAGESGTLVMGVPAGSNLPAPPVASTFSCAADGGFTVSFTAGIEIFVVTSCTATLDAPTEVSSKTGVAFYFAHGSANATMLGSTQFSDGGYDVGTLSATW